MTKENDVLIYGINDSLGRVVRVYYHKAHYVGITKKIHRYLETLEITKVS